MKSNIADVIGLRETRVIFRCEILVIFVKSESNTHEKQKISLKNIFAVIPFCIPICVLNLWKIRCKKTQLKKKRKERFSIAWPTFLN